MSMIKIKIDIFEAMISFVSNIDEKTMLKQNRFAVDGWA